VLPVLIGGLLAAPAAAGAQETQDTTRLPAGMRTARAAFQAAYVGLDPGSAAELFADSAVVDFQGQIFSGKSSIATSFLPSSVQGLSSVRFGTSSYRITDAEIVENGTYFVVPDGAPAQSGAYRTTWRRMADGSWKVARLEIYGAA